MESDVEHRAHQHREYPIPEFVRDKESNVAGVVTLWLEGPFILKPAERAFQILDENFQIGTVERHAAGECFADQLERHRHVGNHNFAAVFAFRALFDFQRMTQRHELRIFFHVRDKIEHLLRAVTDTPLVRELRHRGLAH
jgi:hypothetical protein